MSAALTRLTEALQPVWGVLFVLFYLIGFLTAFAGLLSLYASSRRGHGNYLGAGVSIIIGSLLASFPAWLNTLTWTAFNTDAPGSLVLHSTNTGGSAAYAASLALFFAVLQLVGLWGVAKGTLMFRDAVDDRSKLSIAVTFVLGGIAALNMLTILNAVSQSFGGSVQAKLSGLLQF